jgi:hypothetical protein
VSLTEYGTERLPLEPQDRDYLAGLALGASGDDAAVIRGLTPTGQEPDQFALTVGGYLGRLALPSGGVIDVGSRFATLDVLEVLRVALALPAPLPLAWTHAAAAPLLPEIIANAFCHQVETLTSRGLAKNYRNWLNTSPPYAGRLRPDIHIRRFAARPDRLVTQTRVLTRDTVENRALFRGLLLLRHLPLAGDLPLDLPTRVRRLFPIFSSVTSVPMTADQIRAIPPTSLTQRYGNALSLAAVIVTGMSLGPLGHGLPSNSLMFFMPGVWEAYVMARLRAALPSRKVDTKFRFTVSDAGHEGVADGVVWAGPSSLVVDAKYKHQQKAPSTDDIYQMVTYCHRLKVPRAALVYPQFGLDRIINVGDFKLHVIGLSTSDDSGQDGFETRIQSLFSAAELTP